MSTLAVVYFESAGQVSNDGTLVPKAARGYGEYLPYCCELVDPLCEELQVQAVGSFFSSDYDIVTGDPRDPVWQDAPVVLDTFEALVSDLIARRGSELTPELSKPSILWEARNFELIARLACKLGERMYISA